MNRWPAAARPAAVIGGGWAGGLVVAGWWVGGWWLWLWVAGSRWQGFHLLQRLVRFHFLVQGSASTLACRLHHLSRRVSRRLHGGLHAAPPTQTVALLCGASVTFSAMSWRRGER